jgi:hypothetical protein
VAVRDEGRTNWSASGARQHFTSRRRVQRVWPDLSRFRRLAAPLAGAPSVCAAV